MGIFRVFSPHLNGFYKEENIRFEYMVTIYLFRGVILHIQVTCVFIASDE